MNSWDRKEAKEVLLRRVDVLTIDPKDCRICFFCGNDDIALGAADAMRELNAAEAMQKGQITFCGFDGIDQFTAELRRRPPCIWGVTAVADIFQMKEIVVDLVRKETEGKGPGHPTGHIVVDVREIIASGMDEGL
jgi:hypothetical protein